MTHLFEDGRKWNALSIDEKLNALHESIGKLFGIAEELSHKHHASVDAINLLHGRLDAQAKTIHAMQRHTTALELMG